MTTNHAGQVIAATDTGNAEETRNAPSTSPASPRLSWVKLTFLLSNIGLALLVVLGWARFGSVSSALGFLAGDRLVPDAYSKDFGTAKAREDAWVTFNLTNYSNRTIRVVGFKSSCTCAYASDLPMTIPAAATAPLKVKIRSNSFKAFLSESIRLFTDDHRVRDPSLTVTGRYEK